MRLPTEPGYYADGKWGIRIESVVIVREAKTPNNFGKNGYLGFERVTMVSFTFDLRLRSRSEMLILGRWRDSVLSRLA